MPADYLIVEDDRIVERESARSAYSEQRDHRGARAEA
jgi:hypothetical protein